MRILGRLEGISFDQATSSWPGRFIRSDAEETLRDSVRVHLGACGWGLQGEELVVI
jgi:hypothetical protein